MTYISQQKFQELLKNAPPGTTEESLSSILFKRGHRIEGMPDPAKAQRYVGVTEPSKPKNLEEMYRRSPGVLDTLTNVAANIYGMGKSGFLKTGESLHKGYAAATGDTSSLEGYRQFYGLKTPEEIDVKQLTPEERGQMAGEAAIELPTGAMEIGFAPTVGTLQTLAPEPTEWLGKQIGTVASAGSMLFKEKVVNKLGVDLTPEQEKIIDDGFNTLTNLVLARTGEKTGKFRKAESVKAGLYKTITEQLNKNDFTGAKTNIAKLEGIVKEKPSITGNLIGTTLEGVGALGKGTSKYVYEAVKETIPQVTKGVKALGDVALKKAKESIPDVFTKDVETMRSEKMTKGYEEQNVKLKSVNEAFKKNTKTFTNEDGTKVTVTPIDTLSKYEIYPEIEEGAINMGDYKTGTGARGKIKNKVEELDIEIESNLKDTGILLKLENLRNEAIEKVKNDSDFKRSGTVQSNIDRVNTRFDDYKNSYGDTIDINELNSIRKKANEDWSPETHDTSRIVGDIARDKVYNATVDKIVRDLLREQGNLLAAEKYASKINGTKIRGGSLTNMIARTTGAIIGSTVKNAPVIGPILGMLGGEYIAKALKQSQFKSLGAETKALGQTATSKIKAVIQRSKSSEPSQSANAIPKSDIKVSTEPTVAQPKGKVKSGFKETISSNLARKAKSFEEWGELMQKEFKGFNGSNFTKTDIPKIIIDKATLKNGVSLEDIYMMLKKGDTDLSLPKGFKSGEIPPTNLPKAQKSANIGDMNLINEAKKYKSAEEFVKAQGGKDYITVYHRTNEPLETFGKDGIYSKENKGEFFVSNKKNGQAEGYGKNVVELRVKKSDLEINDEFPSGEKHYTLPVKKADEYLKTKSELIDKWNKAHKK